VSVAGRGTAAELTALAEQPQRLIDQVTEVMTGPLRHWGLWLDRVELHELTVTFP
jgi:hypothetical protein